MQNNFDDYIKQLQNLESSENIASLKSLRDMHSVVLLHFPAIMEGVNNLIASGSVPEGIINDIKEKIPVLSRCRKLHDELSASEKSHLYSSSIERLLQQKETVTLLEVEQYQSDLADLLQKNDIQIKTEKNPPVQTETPTQPAAPITLGQFHEIWRFLQQGNKLQAVKYYKEATGFDLKNSKDYIDKIAQCNSFKDALHIAHEVNKSKGSFGCYIATAVYGSYDCPEVWTLRRYRDIVLDSTWYGRLFIQIYYTISPILVKRFGNAEWFRNLFLKNLNKWVIELNQQGFENTPYVDKY